jgi:FtsZ-binding cell division protein ZapB
MERQLKSDNVMLRNEVRNLKSEIALSESRNRNLENQVNIWKAKTESLGSNLSNFQSVNALKNSSDFNSGKSSRMFKKSLHNEIMVVENR